jgi:ribonuclease-3
VFLDAGFDAARRVVEAIYARELAELDPTASGKDAKTRLQEWLQARKMAVPEYAVARIEGEAHAQTFTVECRIAALNTTTTGTGPSRRTAEQRAAQSAYDQLTRKTA